MTLWFWLGGAVLLLVAIGQCTSKPSGSTASQATTDAQEAIVAAVQTQSPPPLQSLSRVAVSRGLTHARLAAIEGLAGAMIYSQDCYDALGRAFSWEKLDACGAFDAETVLNADDDDAISQPTETAWFDSEAAAGRFLKAAIAAGEPADEADTRWSDLQARVAAKHKGKAALGAPTSEPNATEAPDQEDAAESIDA